MRNHYTYSQIQQQQQQQKVKNHKSHKSQIRISLRKTLKTMEKPNIQQQTVNKKCYKKGDYPCANILEDTQTKNKKQTK